MKTLKKPAAILTAILMAMATFSGCGGSPTPADSSAPGAQNSAAADSKPSGDTAAETGVLPRSETLYYNGLQWGTPSNFNPFGAGGTCAFITNAQPVPRELMYETLFMYNMLDGKLYGLLGKDYTWNGNVLTVTLNPDAKWNDGEAFTADDVVYTYELSKKYQLNISAIWDYIDGIKKVDEHTVEITGKAEGFNPLMIEDSIAGYYIVPQHVWSKFEEECGNDGAKLIQLVNDKDIVSSGPYNLYTYDDTKVVLMRDENYWGQAASMFGKLPAPKYIAHNIFKDNAAGDAAFKAGQVDVGQQYTSQIWKMWESGLPIETYLPDPPYFIPGTIPNIVFNTTRPGLDDPAVRKAIAMSLDYNMIGQNAMSGYTAPMVPSLMLPTDTEQALIDTGALGSLQWGNADVENATKLLDEAGWVAGGDGIRAKDGVKLSFKAECPTGWSDWEASLEVVSQSARAIGIDVQVYKPETSIWQNDQYTGNFDILMCSYAGVGIASPWARARQTMSSVGVAPIGENAYWNFGRYQNDRVDELISLIPAEKDAAKLKEYWTELNKIYLTDVPTAGLMYRPLVFHEVNTSVWDGFPKQDDGTNVPPTLCCDGYGIAGLYNLTAK